MLTVPEKYRVTKDHHERKAIPEEYWTAHGDGNRGIFLIDLSKTVTAKVQVHDKADFAVIAIRLYDLKIAGKKEANRTPTVSELFKIKSHFWPPEDLVLLAFQGEAQGSSMITQLYHEKIQYVIENMTEEEIKAETQKSDDAKIS